MCDVQRHTGRSRELDRTGSCFIARLHRRTKFPTDVLTPTA
jgi:hypothetical protein